MKDYKEILKQAETNDRILKANGNMIISSLATPADLIYHMGVKYKIEVEEALSKQKQSFINLLESKRTDGRYSEAQAINEALDDLLEELKDVGKT